MHCRVLNLTLVLATVCHDQLIARGSRIKFFKHMFESNNTSSNRWLESADEHRDVVNEKHFDNYVR